MFVEARNVCNVEEEREESDILTFHFCTYNHLVNKFIDYIPEPLVGYLKRDGSIGIYEKEMHKLSLRDIQDTITAINQSPSTFNQVTSSIKRSNAEHTQDVVEQVAVVVIGLEALLQRWSSLQTKPVRAVGLSHH